MIIHNGTVSLKNKIKYKCILSVQFCIVKCIYLSRVDHNWKIRARKQRTDVGKYSFVNMTVTDWNQLTAGGIGALTGNTYSFRKRVRKVITSEAK